MGNYFIYIMASSSGVIYIGVTNDLERRVYEHKNPTVESSGSYTARYNCKKLVYFERYDDIEQAIAREKTLKKWRRSKKSNLITNMNPEWNDLATDFFQS